ncbi:3-methyl-2-oxobutanoate hydroxymethyltransferase [Hanstruepera neustonica]|uniref:3-methyl-2-oxobutanoate hydroxymethyltransferase n=1 Tax=Hanstruepera neustonica TaxID=1445657 RepID=A0A2K1DXL9_9FLAO|nr:nuclear transport factor 2 family protein [Hanstruepera neustonica]PNQ72750.1 3-methyl-2-oxobutanoate hydroxymethyltransferase [Hanstruepera neustonica]
MQRFIFYLTVLLSSTMMAQESAELDAEQTIKTFFEGFHKGDTTLMKSVMMDKVLMQTVYKTQEGKDVLVTDEPGKLITAVATRPADQKWEEKILGYSVQVDGNMANVWTPYEFWFNGNFSHCGVNSFQLFHDNGTWKIIYLIDTRRRQGCQD